MQVINIALLLITVGLIVAPVGAVVVVYRDDLSGLVIPPEVKDAMNGDTSFILNDNVNSINGYGSDDPNSILNSFVVPNFVSANIDEKTQTFTVRVNVTNPLNYDLTLNQLSADIQSIQGQTLASVNIASPFTIYSGQSRIVEVQGSWTQVGDTFITDHWYDSSVTIAVANIVVNVNGVTVERATPLTVSLPITLQGVLVGQ
jgi:hypothetical protein